MVLEVLTFITFHFVPQVARTSLIAQLVEHWSRNPIVPGSSPGQGNDMFSFISLLEERNEI